MSRSENEQPANEQPAIGETRRGFLKSTSSLVAGGALVGTLPIARSAHAAGSDTIRLGL